MSVDSVLDPVGTRLHDLLEKTSRTFALAIPQLPEPTLREVTVAYLLFRIADTFEDATVLWNREQRQKGLAEFGGLLEEPSAERAGAHSQAWLETPPTDHPGYVELLQETPLVIAAMLELRPEAIGAITHHTQRTAEGMARFVERAGDDGVLWLEDLADLRNYCYVVAGIVGEMLTDLFVLSRPGLERVAPYLRDRAALFGEGLQLVNILRDSASDHSEGRNFVPPKLEREGLFELARRDLESAQEYAMAIQRANGPGGVVAFTALPVALAGATLDKVERKGPGSKISRADVLRLYSKVHRAIEAGRPVFPTADPTVA